MSAAKAKEKPKCQQHEKSHFQVRHAGDPVHRFGVNGVKRKGHGGEEGRPAVLEQALARGIENQHDGRVNEHIGQVESIRKWSEKLVAEQESQRHHRPIIVRDAIGPFERPHVRGKDRSQVMEVLQVYRATCRTK